MHPPINLGPIESVFGGTAGAMQGHSSRMEMALEQARRAASSGEVPVGAVLIDSENGDVLAADHNRVEALHDPLAHAELLVLQSAARRLGEKRLTATDLYVTLEPCPMCAGAISLARVRTVSSHSAATSGTNPQLICQASLKTSSMIAASSANCLRRRQRTFTRADTRCASFSITGGASKSGRIW